MQTISAIADVCKIYINPWYQLYGMHTFLWYAYMYIHYRMHLEQDYNARDTRVHMRAHVCTYHAVTHAQSNQPPHFQSLMRLAPHQSFLLLLQLQRSVVKRRNTCISLYSIQQTSKEVSTSLANKSEVTHLSFRIAQQARYIATSFCAR